MNLHYTVYVMPTPQAEGSTQDNVGLFRIDTETGKTWEFVTGIDQAGRSYKHWIPIEEDSPVSR